MNPSLDLSAHYSALPSFILSHSHFLTDSGCDDYYVREKKQTNQHVLLLDHIFRHPTDEKISVQVESISACWALALNRRLIIDTE